VGDADGSNVVNQALGMISVQADCTIAAAAVLLETRARDTDQFLAELAQAVVDRTTDFYRPE
jgi:hypothetical protein